MVVSHLPFANNTLIFCDLDKEHLEALSWAFMWFEAIFDLKIILNKSELIPVGEVSNAEELVGVVGSLPSTYPGLPLGASFKSLPIWDVVEERFQKRLAMRKRQYLSKRGRFTLIKSTLSSSTNLLCLYL